MKFRHLKQPHYENEMRMDNFAAKMQKIMLKLCGINMINYTKKRKKFDDFPSFCGFQDLVR